MEWYQAVEVLRQHIVRISTPQGSGTGFLVSRSHNDSVCAIATAAHVVSHAHHWEQPIRVEHAESGKNVLLKSKKRAIFIKEEKDTAVIILDHQDIPFPEIPCELAPEGKTLKVGIEVGWLGFPAISAQDLCFFSGRVSAYNPNYDGYLVDGVAINGVSGGPAFCILKERITLMGVVSAYVANTVTGTTLPGLSLVRNVVQLQEIAKTFNSIDEAKQNEEPLEPEQNIPSA